MGEQTQEGGVPGSAVKVSVIVTIRNEAKHIRHLLDSLVHQAHLHELVIVDARSTDRTVEICRSYEDRLPIRIIVQPCSRGLGRNLGAAAATGDLLAFIDGDCIANAEWLSALVRANGGAEDRIVAGFSQFIGFWAFTKLHRVELPHLGQDTTWPSCNLLYPRALFQRIGGFDAKLVTAEDIDLNFRAIEAGGTIVHAPDAIVYARARDSISGFARQAYWNGYGRKQLTQKHGRLWHQYRLTDMIRLQGGSVWGILRLGFGFIGYVDAKLGRRPPH